MTNEQQAYPTERSGQTRTTDATDALGEIADTLDHLHGALQLPLPPSMHVSQMKAALPELRDKLRAVYVALTGDDPWGG